MQQELGRQISYQSNQDYDEYSDYAYDMELPISAQCSVEVPKIGIRIITLDEVYETLERQVRDISEVIPFEFDGLLELLNMYGWNKDKLTEAFFHSEQKQKELRQKLELSGITPTLTPQQVTQIKNDNLQIKQCGICLENIEGNRSIPFLACGHQFCSDCWNNLIIEKSQNKQAFFFCMMENCPQRITFSFIKHVTQGHGQVFQGYKQALCKRYIEENKYLAWCPGVDCKYCIEVNDLSSKEIHCPCGQVFCFRCRDEIHVPSPCDMVQKWLQEVKKDEANIKWIMVNTKICPFCKKAVERSEGCNYMNCKPPGGCNKNFCYVCSQPWEPTHSDHFKCSQYKPDKEEEMQKNKEKSFLEKYNFYYERWLNSEGARKKTLLRKKTIQAVQQTIFELIQVTYHDSYFLEQAVKELADSRLVLKWSYCFAYYISQNHQKSVQLFGHYQQQFEFACEKLAIEMIKQFDFIEEIQRTKGNGMTAFDMFQKFSVSKTAIQQAMAVCSKFKVNLIEAINSGEIFIES